MEEKRAYALEMAKEAKKAPQAQDEEKGRRAVGLTFLLCIFLYHFLFISLLSISL